MRSTSSNARTIAVICALSVVTLVVIALAWFIPSCRNVQKDIALSTAITRPSDIEHASGRVVYVIYPIPDADIPSLARRAQALPELRGLTFEDASLLTADGIKPLATAHQIEGLYFKKARKLGDDAAQRLSKMRNLQGVGISGSPLLTDQGISQFSTLNLRNVDVSGSSISNDGVRRLSDAKNLQNVNLRGCQLISSEGVSYLALMAELAYLDISFCNKVTSADIVFVLQHINLKSLYVQGLPISDAVLAAGGASRSLKLLDISGCTGFSSQALIEVHQRRPDLSILQTRQSHDFK